ncbi:MAG: hypothetical protein IPH62_14085 [Ignavibacteriae bacterium]|nr:hypothetical protein [Ignavibacteriota bacterium]
MKNHFFKSVFIFSLFTFLISCQDDPVSNQEEHFEAIGTVIYDATGATVVSILRGVTDDTLKISNGELSDHFSVKFYDENENIINPPSDENVKLGYEISDTTTANWWQHEGEEGGYEFHFNGLKSGVTTFELFIVHEGHNDYRSGLIPLVVK